MASFLDESQACDARFMHLAQSHARPPNHLADPYGVWIANKHGDTREYTLPWKSWCVFWLSKTPSERFCENFVRTTIATNTTTTTLQCLVFVLSKGRQLISPLALQKRAQVAQCTTHWHCSENQIGANERVYRPSTDRQAYYRAHRQACHR